MSLRRLFAVVILMLPGLRAEASEIANAHVASGNAFNAAIFMIQNFGGSKSRKEVDFKRFCFFG